MSTHSSSLFNSDGNSRFHAHQAASSASQVETMVRDDLRRGHFAEVQSRVGRIEELVSEHLLETDKERDLLLLAARLLEGAGETKRAYQFTGRLLADKERLEHKFLSELRRFRARLALNMGDLERARGEVSLTERVVMETVLGLGQVEHSIDNEDLSKVTPATWLLSAEIGLAEKEYERSLQDLANAHSAMLLSVKRPDESVMFELLSALVLVGMGDSAGAPAIAYLYELHVHLSDESPVEALTSGRISAAAGDMGHVVGLSKLEAERWRRYGPDADVVKYYLLEGTSIPGLANVLEKLPPPSELIAALDASLEPGNQGASPRVTVGELEAKRFALLPMAFLFEFFRLEEVTGMFDYNMKTGHLVIDWSDCDEGLLRDAIAVGAVSELALRCKGGTIYINNGSYVDACFESTEEDLTSLSVEDVIFEIFRISTAGLPGAGARQFNGGPEIARIPERVNFRPNNFNLDLTKRLDHMRSGRVEEPDGELDLDLAFADWGSKGRLEDGEELGSVERTIESRGDSKLVGDRIEWSQSEVGAFGSLLGVLGAEDVVALELAVVEALAGLGLGDCRVEIVLANCDGTFRECGLSAELCEVWDKFSAGPVSMILSFRQGIEVVCGEAVSVVMRTAVQRLRNLPGRGVVGGGLGEAAGFIAEDPATQAMLSDLRDFAQLDGVGGNTSGKLKHILLEGERGVGKELLARLIHTWSGRSEEKFCVVNLGAITKELGSAEVFGAKKGSYTSASSDRVGYIENAEKGTLFLDELDEATDELQALLKRVVQFGTYNIVGSPEEMHCDVRFVAATNRVASTDDFIKKDLRDRFLPIRVPALRERKRDIAPSAQFFAGEEGYVLPEVVLGYLEGFKWPGNLRQLRTVVERVCALAKSEADITLAAFELSVQETGPNPAVVEVEDGPFYPLAVGETHKDRLNKVSAGLIRHYLDLCGGNKTHVGELLGMTRQTLGERMKALGIGEYKS